MSWLGHIGLLALVASTAAAEPPTNPAEGIHRTYLSARSWARLGDKGQPVLAFVSGTNRRSLSCATTSQNSADVRLAAGPLGDFDKRLNITVLANTRPVVESTALVYPDLVRALDKSIPFGGYLLALCRLGYHIVVSDGSAQGLPWAVEPARLVIVDDAWSASLPADWRQVVSKRGKRARVQVWSPQGQIQTIQSSQPRSPDDPPRLRIRVTAGGVLLVDSRPVSLEKLDGALAELAKRHGVALYCRDAPNSEPPAVASEVIARIMKWRVPIAFAIDEDELNQD
jgi:hypothetical protein